MLYFGALAAIAGVVHVIFGAFYFGTHLFAEAVFLPAMRKAKTNAELSVHQALFKKMGPFFGGLGMGALVTGLLYLFAKFGTDFGALLALPESRTIIIALAIFVVMILIATFVHRPIAEWIAAQDLASSPTGEPSPEIRAKIEKFSSVAHITTGGVLIVIVLMVIAANGGI